MNREHAKVDRALRSAMGNKSRLRRPAFPIVLGQADPPVRVPYLNANLARLRSCSAPLPRRFRKGAQVVGMLVPSRCVLKPFFPFAIFAPFCSIDRAG